MSSTHHAEHYRKQLCYLTRKTQERSSGKFICNWNITATGDKQGIAAFPWRKPPPRSTENFAVIIYTTRSIRVKFQVRNPGHYFT
jgi:hypothetical protein